MTEKVINLKIGSNIRRYRLLYNIDKGNMTQKELARRIGVTTSMIGGLESKNINQGISVYNLYKISEVLGVPIDKFFE